MSKNTPPYLLKAKEIFLDELTRHLNYFDAVLALQTLEFNIYELKSRFHLIKGGAGFLKMELIKEIASEAEKYLEDHTENTSKEKISEFVEKIRNIKV